MGAGQGGANREALQGLMESRGQQKRPEFRVAGDPDARRDAVARRSARAEGRASRAEQRPDSQIDSGSMDYSKGVSLGPGRAMRGGRR